LFTKYFLMAFEAITLNKVRAFLTTLGIIIGVFSVIVMISLGQASQEYITNQVKGLGAGVLIITPGNPKTQSFGPPGINTTKTITIDDAKIIESITGVLYVSPNVFIQSIISFNKSTSPGMIIGTDPNVIQARGFSIDKGRFYTDQESRSGSRVIVLGVKIANELFKNSLDEPINSKIKINDQRYRVIGILKEQGSGLFGSVDDQSFMPTTTFQQTVKSGDGLNSIFVKVKSEDLLPIVQQKIQTTLRYRHSIRTDEDDDFKIQTQAELLKTVGVITQVFTLLLAGIAAISLIVGGIGIMNIMLVSVTERTREIGVRKAVGAKRKDILIQFLIESASISLVGGTVGIILGLGLTKIITSFAKLPFVVSPIAVIGAFLFSAGVGIFFGLYPANKASKLDPVDALRYE
jgi:putative ABC transport system permease protein